MPATSSLARLQQAMVLGLAALSLLWAGLWSSHPAIAAAGSLCILLVHAPILALEFVLLQPASRHDATPKASGRELVAAWWREVVLGVLVFGWRQPFAWRRWPDRLQGAPGARGFVFIHGFVCNRGFWAPWLQHAAERGHAFVAVNLEPVFGDIDGYATSIEAAVQRVTAATGAPPVLVCHSMGGLAARAWLRRQHAGRVAHVVTIGSPHHGTWMARFGRAASGRQMRMDGAWLRDLASGEPPADGRFTCWYSNADNVVFPPSTATLPGADNRLVAGAAHIDLAFRPEILEQTFALARRS